MLGSDFLTDGPVDVFLGDFLGGSRCARSGMASLRPWSIRIEDDEFVD